MLLPSTMSPTLHPPERAAALLCRLHANLIAYMGHGARTEWTLEIAYTARIGVTMATVPPGAEGNMARAAAVSAPGQLVLLAVMDNAQISAPRSLRGMGQPATPRPITAAQRPLAP